MSIFSRIFKARGSPKNSLPGDGYRPYVGRTTSGNSVTQRSSMQLTAVYCCVRVLSEAVAGLPLITYRYGKNGTKERATDHPLYLLLHDEPNPEMTSFSFRETLMTHLLLYGNAYAQIIRNGKGDVVALYPLMPDRMKVDRDEHGHIYYEYMKQQDEAATMKTGTVILLALMGSSVIPRSPWPRTPSVWHLPVRSMALPSSQTARLRELCWNIRVC